MTQEVVPEYISMSLYMIMRDVINKKDICNLQVISSHNFILIKGVYLDSRKIITMLPSIGLDNEVDLNDLEVLCLKCEKENEDLFICFCSDESVM